MEKEVAPSQPLFLRNEPGPNLSNKSGTACRVGYLADGDDTVDRNKIVFATLFLHSQHSVFATFNLAAKNRRSSTIYVNLLPHEATEYLFHILFDLS